MIKKYRKKPVVIEAIELEWSTKSQQEIIDWSKGTIKKGFDGGLIIPTLEGPMIASTGDYIIKGVNGEFYPCSLIFSKKVMRRNRMKEVKEYLDKFRNSTVYEYSMSDMLKEAQKDAYNQAIDDAVDPFKTSNYYDENVGWCIRQVSILKLKK